MIKLYLLVFNISLNLCFCTNSTEFSVFNSGGRIVGGEKIQLSTAPYQVSIQNKGRHECGGAIISPNFIITAAHCTYLARAKDFTVRVGTDKVQTGGEIYPVKKIKNHPFFNPFNYNNDFAILELTTKIVLKAGFKEAIVLPTQDDPIADETSTLVSGWGDTQNDNESSSVLRGVVILLVNQKICKEIYSNLSNQMLCAGDLINGGKDSCQGDSGGPMKRISDNKLIGITSFGMGCARPGYPGVYSRVASVRNWINTNARMRRP